MITKNFKNFIYSVLESNNTDRGILPIKAIDGNTYYCVGNAGSTTFSEQCFPLRIGTAVLTYNDAGILLGSGTTISTEDDYIVESPIYGGFTNSVIRDNGVDENGNPYSQFIITINNTSSTSITISEIGYQQRVWATSSQGGTTGANARIVLFDRTLLSEPIAILSSESCTIKYTLKTMIF